MAAALSLLRRRAPRHRRRDGDGSVTATQGQQMSAHQAGASQVVARLAAAVCGLAMTAFGVWALGWPVSFADLIDFPPYNAHLLHDVGAFQIGVGASLLLALVRSDALTAALGGFLVAGILHTLNHGLDLPLGGHRSDPWALGALVVVATIGLVAQLRQVSVARQPREPQR